MMDKCNYEKEAFLVLHKQQFFYLQYAAIKERDSFDVSHRSNPQGWTGSRFSPASYVELLYISIINESYKGKETQDVSRLLEESPITLLVY